MTLADNRATVKFAVLRVYPLKTVRESSGVFFQNHDGFGLPVGRLEH